MAGRRKGWRKPEPGSDQWWANKIAEAYNGHGPAGITAEDLVRQLRSEANVQRVRDEAEGEG